jgi:hypothetical protein
MNQLAMFDAATASPALLSSNHPGVDFAEGRHRRVYPELVVHLVFEDMSEIRLGPDTVVGRSLGYLAGWLFER